MFPVLRKRRVKKSVVKTTKEVQVYCKCRKPELPGEQLNVLANCKEWYHLDTCTTNNSCLFWVVQFFLRGAKFLSKISSVCVCGGGGGGGAYLSKILVGGEPILGGPFLP